MLAPDTTVLLTDALQPPPEYRVEQAVATTYSLNLTAMLLAPMTFTLGGVEDAGTLASADPVSLLDAVERHVQHTTVFVQAGGIHVPASHSRIHAFLEDSICEVLPPREGHLFHPKIWAVRYIHEHSGALHHRLLISSRNLTLDNSWDTILVLDEDPHGAIPATPAADLIATLPGLATAPLREARRTAITDLAETLRTVSLAAPEPFTGGSLLPLGLDDARTWPFPANPDRILAISPFLSRETLRNLRGAADDATLVSRAESLNLLGRHGLAGWSAHVLHRGVEQTDDDAEPTHALDGFTAVVGEDGDTFSTGLDGLHAKTVVLDLPGGQSMTVTGSANLTTQAWGGGMEMGAVLTGPTTTCGVRAVLGDDDHPGLARVLQPFTPQTENGESDPAIATNRQLEEFHRALARQRPRLEVTPLDEHRVRAHLTWALPDELPGHTRVWLMTVHAQKRPLAASQSWEIDPVNITPYLAVETTAGEGAARVTRRCVLMMRIDGDPLDRRRAALAEILSSSRSVLRYLALLLGLDPQQLSEGAEHAAHRNATGAPAPEGGAAALSPLMLFEPLVRAAARGPQQLASVARQIQELRDMPQAAEVIPAEFLQMWDVVLQTVQARRAP
ncbi:hypothetical protein [Bogoriella caseilytica]|uniref:Uncharacterized protein n=1 Tax=Bogoriella caseilytica TaxID=56055 RepID=A0A3N2BAT4_9MICO|nr:hypothetical protein [Bogoriella caseilytica]ROR72386.1 hypothetical protein EDD31_0737 [Bogoriella caseilytica]